MDLEIPRQLTPLIALARRKVCEENLAALRFSPGSNHIAYFQMEDIAYESDRRILYVYTLGSEEPIPVQLDGVHCRSRRGNHFLALVCE